tara:strand:- start:3431 stop:5365 length:1935 start_codon:yes stop_codon:yes gene_type:complete
MIKYRADIDGLRAVAIIMVLLFHFNIGAPYFSGGFIGVDIFFVISGFLIASLIKRNVERNTFSFKTFYLHRMRRLLPAFAITMLLTVLTGWLVMLPKDFTLLIGSAFYSMLSISNIFFYFNTKGYFGEKEESLPFLHTWSLSVEEQFYLIAPVLLFIFFIFKDRFKLKILDAMLWLLFISTLAISVYFANTNPSFAYFMLPTRFFELLSGVILAIYIHKIPLLNKYLCNILILLAVVGLIFLSFYLDKSSHFPGWSALIISILVCLIIGLGKSSANNVVTKFLSQRILIFIGLISYSLYLVHWPIVAYLNYYKVELNTSVKISLIILTFALASFIWKFIEQPLRYKYKFGFIKTFIILFALPFSMVFMIKLYIYKTQKPFDTYMTYLDGGDKFLGVSRYITPCEDYLGYKDVSDLELKSKCSIKKSNIKNSSNILILGDSHAQALGPFVKELAERDYNVDLFAIGGSLFRFNGIEGLKQDSQKNKMIRLQKYLKNNFNYDYVFINHRSGLNDLSLYEKIMHENIMILKKQGVKKIFIVKDVPSSISSLYFSRCYIKKYFIESINCNINAEVVDRLSEKENEMLESFKDDIVEFLDFTSLFKEGDEYKTLLNDTILYQDSDHLSENGSKLLGKMYLEKYGPVLPK